MEKTPTHLQFGQHHIPALETGDYILDVKQSLKLNGSELKFKGQQSELATKVQFSVQGERFDIGPTGVHSVFPPANSLGDYMGVLPHVIFNRSTLPWERHAAAAKKTDSEEELGQKKQTPWLALLLFRGDELVSFEGTLPENDKQLLEAQTGYVKQLSELKSEKLQAVIPGITLETGQLPEDSTRVIFVKKQVLEPLMPSFQELHYLAHTRQGVDEEGSLTGAELAVVIGNRLPKPGADSVVHLVSVEHRYTKDGFDFQGAANDEVVALITLKSWRFSSLSRKHTFRGLLMHLNQEQIFRTPAPDDLDLNTNSDDIPLGMRKLFEAAKSPLGANALVTDRADREILLKDYHFLIGRTGNVYNQAGNGVLKLDSTSSDQDVIAAIRDDGHSIPENAPLKSAVKAYWWIEDGRGRYFIRNENDYIIAQKLELDHAPTLRLAETGDDTADILLHQGYAPIPHFFRRGGKSVSWYRGPLATSEKRTSSLDRDVFSVKTADELLRYHANAGMFDVSCAAAWELGRLLALRSKRFSTGLHKWRRSHARAVAHVEHHEAHLHLPVSGASVEDKEAFPPELHAWLDRLWDLQGIPFNYLIPDDRMLPPESLRFFTLDPDWMGCLVHGAFSVGSDAGLDHWCPSENNNSAKNVKHPVNQQLDARNAISGFILKSEVVSGWPGMQVEVSRGPAEKPTPLDVRTRMLAPGILLCLFEGEADRVDFHLQPEVLHFGFHQDDTGALIKAPRNESGEEKEDIINLANPKDASSPGPGDVILEKPPADWENFPGVVNIERLFDAIEDKWKTSFGFADDFGSAHFALAMIEGVDKVIFSRKK